MPRLILKFDERELHECAVGAHPVSIGRLPGNTVIIDHPAVSGRHARVYREVNDYVLEDLKSTTARSSTTRRSRATRCSRAISS